MQSQISFGNFLDGLEVVQSQISYSTSWMVLKSCRAKLATATSWMVLVFISQIFGFNVFQNKTDQSSPSAILYTYLIQAMPHCQKQTVRSFSLFCSLPDLKSQCLSLSSAQSFFCAMQSSFKIWQSGQLLASIEKGDIAPWHDHAMK